jgi:nucleotide-binding universal stress UspA family protein
MRILYATDGSEGAHAAGEFLRGLAVPPDTHVHIVTTTDAPEGDALLLAARDRLEGLPVTVTTEGLPGGSTAAAIEAIVAAGDVLDADFIVVGDSGLPAVIRLFISSIAEGVARSARRSVLVVRPGGGTAPESAVVGVDSSARSRDAVLWTARTFPLPPDCALHLVAAVPSRTWTKFLVPSDEDPSVMHEVIRVQTVDEERERALACMDSLARETRAPAAEGATARQVTTSVRQGTPADELIHAAHEAGASLIVVGDHEHSVLDRIYIGSVSEGVLRHAPCSVLIVKTDSAPA